MRIGAISAIASVTNWRNFHREPVGKICVTEKAPHVHAITQAAAQRPDDSVPNKMRTDVRF
jgi:hypothetical protein